MGHDERQRIGSHWLRVVGLSCAVSVSVLGACGSDDEDEHGDHGDHSHEMAVGPASGATCPSDRAELTYEAFGKPFMTKYCTGCHSSQLETPAERMNATPGHDFDVLAGIEGVYEHVDQMAAAGPKSTNTRMPPASGPGPFPTMAEREKLGQWLACEFGPAD